MAVRRLTRSAGDNISFGGINLTGTFTIALVVKRISNSAWHALIEGLTSANAVAWVIELSNLNAVSLETAGASVVSGSVVAADGWVLLVLSRAAGAGQPGDLDQFKAGSWVTRISTNSLNNPTDQTGGSIKVGRYGTTSGDDADVQIATIAIWNGVHMTQAQAQELSAGSASAWDANSAGAPTEHWEYNQASVGTSITGRKAVSSQTAISGTSVVTGDDPASTIYSFSGAAATSLLVPRRRVPRGLIIR
jgi:hypothetical protein